MKDVRCVNCGAPILTVRGGWTHNWFYTGYCGYPKPPSDENGDQ